jgi:preprotein translocase subunit YajC
VCVGLICTGIGCWLAPGVVCGTLGQFDNESMRTVMIGITDAMAATGKAPGLVESLGSMLPMFLAIFVLFYFMLIRPQSKKAKEHQSLLSKVKVGDEVMTNSGLLAKVDKITDDFVALTLSEQTSITMKKTAISQVMPKGTIESVS